MRQKPVTIVNGDLTGQCLPESVPAWEAAGWTVVDDGSSEPGGEQPVPTDEDEMLDFGQDNEEEE